MIKLCLLLVVSAALVGSAPAARKHRIFGGLNAKREDFPFQLFYVVDHIITCGGVLISPTVAITAAHCIPENYNSSYVFGGTNRIFSHKHKAVGKQIIRTLIHEEYDATYGDNNNDIALLFLDPEKPFNFTEYIQAAELPSEDEDYQNSTAVVTVSGWGYQKPNGKFSHRLKYAKLNLVPRKQCINLGGPIKSNVICAGSGDGSKDACDGDSGGPLSIGKKVIGLVSFGWPCGRYIYPGAYADLAKLRGWIRLKSDI